MSGQFVSAKYLPYFAEKENGIWLRICAGVDPRAERSPPACRHGGVLEWRRETSLWRSCPGRTSSAPRSEADAGAAPGGRACDERHRPAGAELRKAQGRHRGDWICLCRGPAGALMEDIVLRLLGWVAQAEQKNIRRRQAWRDGQITLSTAADLCGIPKSAFPVQNAPGFYLVKSRYKSLYCFAEFSQDRSLSMSRCTISSQHQRFSK